VRGRSQHINTAVVEADIHHPTDMGLHTNGIRVITRVVSKLKKMVYLDLMMAIKRRTNQDETTCNVLGENPANTALLKPAVRGHHRLFCRRLENPDIEAKNEIFQN